MNKLIYILFLFAITTKAHAEYRVFQLQVTGPDGVVSRTFPSTLDPEQYRRYHPLPMEMKLSYQETWMCKGNTQDFKALCTNPKPPAEETNPATPAAQNPPPPNEKTATNPP